LVLKSLHAPHCFCASLLENFGLPFKLTAEPALAGLTSRFVNTKRRQTVNTKAFDRIFIIIFENQLQTTVMENDYMRKLAARGVLLSNYFGVAHPSQPNYIALTAGLPFVKDDTCPSNIPDANIVDLLEAKGVTWKAYMEDMPDGDASHKAVCISADQLYWRKHNPFISFDNVRNDPKRLAKVVNAKQFGIDVKNNALPQYSWYTPNIQNDGHTPPNDFQPGNRVRAVNYLSRFLKSFLDPLLANPNFTKGTLIVITFDESFPHKDNSIYTALLGEMVKAGSVETDRYNHYSLLRTVEENFQLGSLNRNDVTANWFRFLFGLEPLIVTWEDHTK
jgi:Phosphoesterase family